MMSAKPKNVHKSMTLPECGENSLGLSPAVLAKRRTYQPDPWCPKVESLIQYYDPWCDPHLPQTVHYKDVAKAHRVIKKNMSSTPLLKSTGYSLFDINLYFKVETGYKTGSFHQRGAFYALHRLSYEERRSGVVTASLGNWGMALSYEAKQLNIPVNIFFPIQDHAEHVQRCKELGADVKLHGKTLTEARIAAITEIQYTGIGTYINGYDHPHVIAGEGTIAIEILEQLPETDVILIPVGGGGLIAGIAAAAKNLKPDILIYGVETHIGSCFFKALNNESPYTIDVELTRNVPTAGYNAFHTAQYLIDKMILVQEDWLSQALAHLMEDERLVVERMGALGYAVLFSEPNLVPELRNKNVVCVLSGSNIDMSPWVRALQRAKIIEGRLIPMELELPMGGEEYRKVLQLVSHLGCNILHYEQDNQWLSEHDVNKLRVTLLCETRGWKHANTLRRVMDKLFPNMCKFSEELDTNLEKCQCYPKMWPSL